MRKRPQHGIAGFSLVEIIVGLGIAGVVFMAVGLQLTHFGENSDRIHEIDERNKIADRLTRLVNDPRHVVGSSLLPGNEKLRACLVKDTRLDCDATSPNVQIPVRIGEFDESRATMKQLLAGTTSNPVSYGSKGQVSCDPATVPRCPRWKARAFFWAQCANGAAACAQATTVYFRVQVFPAPEANFRAPVPQAIPPEPSFSTPTAPLTMASFAIPFAVRQTFVNSQPCGAGSRQTGFDAEGRIRCECLPGTVQTGTVTDAGNVLPVCEITEQRCPAGLLAQGKDPAGALICRPPRVVSAGTIMMNSRRCPRDAWLSSSTSGGCSVVSGGSRKANPLIICSTNSGNCYIEETP